MANLKTPLRYPGGKSRATNKISQFFPDFFNDYGKSHGHKNGLWQFSGYYICNYGNRNQSYSVHQSGNRDLACQSIGDHYFYNPGCHHLLYHQWQQSIADLGKLLYETVYGSHPTHGLCQCPGCGHKGGYDQFIGGLCSNYHYAIDTYGGETGDYAGYRNILWSANGFDDQRYPRCSDLLHHFRE
jgi:hypothetical protein